MKTLKVNEVIEILKTMPQDAPLVLCDLTTDDEDAGSYNVTKESIEKVPGKNRETDKDCDLVLITFENYFNDNPI